MPRLGAGGTTDGAESIKLRGGGAKSFSSPFQPRRLRVTPLSSFANDPCRNSEESKGAFLWEEEQSAGQSSSPRERATKSFSLCSCQTRTFNHLGEKIEE